jgi:hypothetical protein
MSKEYIKSAKGLKGLLCVSTGFTFLRVTNEDNTYTDYDIIHSDMNITIDDDDAHIYKNGDQYYIDYSPETLGE